MAIVSKEHAYELRAAIEQVASTLSDEAALDVQELFPLWRPDYSYTANERIRYNSKLYRVIQSHTSQANWTPDLTPSLFAEVAPPGEIPVWRQPLGAEDAYMKDDKVWYPDKEGAIFISLIDYNTWQPGVYGWEIQV